MRIWIKDPLAIFAEGAERGVRRRGDAHREPASGGARRRSALTRRSTPLRHVVLPGLVNTHHHFYQTLTRAHPSAINKRALPLARRALSDLGAAEARTICRLASRLALTELMLSGCTTAADHHYLYPEGLENAVDIEVEEARGLACA